jgi:hypothetical protein
MKLTVLWDVAILMMEAVSTSDTSVNFYETIRRHPEDGLLDYYIL